MKKILLTYVFITVACYAFCQDFYFEKNNLTVNEPFKEGAKTVITDTIEINIKSKNQQDTIKLLVGRESTLSNYKLIENPPNKSFKDGNIYFDKGKAKFYLAITTNLFSDKDELLIFKLNTLKGEQVLVDTLRVLNVYPFTAKAPMEYKLWDDPKSADLFIGSNFDFIENKTTLSDWYGGVRVFLPNITKFSHKNTIKEPTWGFAAGIYQCKSLSNFNNGQPDSYTQDYYRIISSFTDSKNNRYYILRYDTLRVTNKIEINNWGLYFTTLKQISSYKHSNNFVANIYLGFHAEVIRRNVVSNFELDTLAYKVETVVDSIFLNESSKNYRFAPQTQHYTFYDGYFGISCPIQFLWKDVLETKIVIVSGIGSPGNVRSWKPPYFFYLVQFDLLTRLSGLNLNIGGEVRGYLPNESPFITVYLGTSFNLTKFKDLKKN